MFAPTESGPFAGCCGMLAGGLVGEMIISGR